MRTYDLVLFDWDGTLSDSWPWFTRALNDAAVRFRFRQVDAAESERLRSLRPRQILAELGLSWWKLPFFTRYMRARMSEGIQDIPLFDGTPDLISRLADARIALGVVTTNSERNVRDRLGPSIASRIAHYACDISMFGKASRIRKLVSRAGVPSSRTILIGDEIRDIEAARSAGIASGAVAWGYATPEALRAAGPTEFYETMGAAATALIVSSSREEISS